MKRRTVNSRQKQIDAIIRNDRGEICHTIKDIVQMALGRNEMVDDTKKYIVRNYKEYIVEFVLV